MGARAILALQKGTSQAAGALEAAAVAIDVFAGGMLVFFQRTVN